MNKNNYRGFGFYALLVIVVIAVWLLLDASQESGTYSVREFESALKRGAVIYVEVEQNKEVPTGSLRVVLDNDNEEKFYVSDVNEMQELMQANNFENYSLTDVPPESWILNLLPLLIVLATMFILFMIMSNQATQGNGGVKMMNFGKCRARLSSSDNEMNFGNVAGLREEKEELVVP